VRGDNLSREVQFVRDVVAGKRTKYLCDTYFGNEETAQVIAVALTGL
jgi:hypothetical protein